MRDFLFAAGLSVAAALLPVSLAFGCINDRDTEPTEQEFKSNYEFKADYENKADYAPQTGSEDADHSLASAAAIDRWAPVAATWSGVGLLVIAGSLAIVSVRRIGRA